MRTLVACTVLLGMVACKSKSSEPEQSAESKSALADLDLTAKWNSGSPAVRALPKANWPCRVDVDNGTFVWTYSYEGAPQTCLHPPQLWEPGCPTSITRVNSSMGISTTSSFTYDDKGRVDSARLTAGLASFERVKYDGERILSLDDLAYFERDGQIIAKDKDDVYARVELTADRVPKRIRTLSDGDVMTDEIFFYADGRLKAVQAIALGIEEPRGYVYDCAE